MGRASTRNLQENHLSRPVRYFALALAACSALLPAALLKAQSDPDALAAYFEGKQATVKIDMPATQEGVDVFPEKDRMDTAKYASRLKSYGVSMHSGESAMVTKVKVKDKIIEFQIGGGGYGTAGDERYTPVTPKPVEKSKLETDLEGQLSAETDPDERRVTLRHLDALRRERERQDRRNAEQAKETNAANQARIEAKRLAGGARFNIRFDSKQSQQAYINPEAVMKALAKWVTFPAQSAAGASPAIESGGTSGQAASGGSADDPASAVRKGMTFEEAEAALGKPTDHQEKDLNGMKHTTCTYQLKDKTIQADFVNGVLVQYTISSH
jgi:hypothetical protein